MPLPVPVLDNKTFDDLTSEAQALIPRLFPAWTDRNPSDPGITLLELFAFLTEAAYYQLDRVPARTLRRFAELAGTTGRPGEPVDQLLCRAVLTRQAVNRAVTPADSEFVAKSGVLAVIPALPREVAAGTPVYALVPLPGQAVLAGPAAAGDARLTVADPSALLAGDLVLIGAIGTGAGQGPAEFATVTAIGSAADPAILSLSGPIAGAYPAGTPLARMSGSGSAMLSVLVRPAPAGSGVLIAEPVSGLTGGLMLGTGPEAVPVLASGVARTKVVTQEIESAQVFPADLVTTVLVVPEGGGDPSGALVQAVFDLIHARSPITTRIRVSGPRYCPVQVAATVVRAFPALLRKDTVQLAAQAALERFLSPLRGGEDGQGWEFGRAVYRSELYQVLQDTTGVDHVQELLLNGDPAAEALPLSGDQAQAAVSLAQLTGATVTVVDA